MATAPWLQQSPLFRSGCPEETRGFLGAKDHHFTPGRSTTGLDVCLNGLYLPGLYVGYLSYGDVEATVAPGASHSEYWLHLPLDGAVAAQSAAAELVADRARGMILAPSQRRWSLTSRPGSARLQLVLDRAPMIRRLEMLIGDAVAGPLEFDPAIDLAGGHGRSLARYILLALRDLEDPGSALAEPATLAAFEEFVTTALLMGQKHSHSFALDRVDRRLAPRDIKRAEAFIDQHLHLPIGIADIAAAAGVPGRTLFKHFRDFRGVAPMRYLRHLRLARARDALRVGRDGDTVTTIAAACGIVHLGRFSTEYRRAYGEPPSETLASARRNRRS